MLPRFMFVKLPKRAELDDREEALVGDAGAAALVLLVVFSRPASLPTDALRTAAVTPSLIEGFLSVGLAGSCTSLPFWKRARRSCQLFVTLDIVVDESSSIDVNDIVETVVRRVRVHGAACVRAGEGGPPWR